MTDEVPITPRTVYAIYTRAKHVYRLKDRVEWWVQFEGSWESLRFGEDRPFDQGELVKITFEKVIQNG